MRLDTDRPSNQLDASREIPPLITPAELQQDAITSMQLQVIVRLEQHVAELGEGNATVETRLHRFLLQHVIHGEVLPDLAHELDRGQAVQPVAVVDENRAAPVAAGVVEVEEPSELRANAANVRLHLLERQQLSFRRATARIADEPRSATDERDRPVPTSLQVHERHDRHEVPDVQARG